MRRFVDQAGRPWEAVAGRESWGAFFAIFVPGPGGGQVRQALLEAETWEDAMRELDGLDESALRALLERSSPKDLG
jgi:hypothetical protein